MNVLQIPFCAFNTIHREGIEKEWAAQFSMALDKTADEHAVEVQALEDSLDNSLGSNPQPTEESE